MTFKDLLVHVDNSEAGQKRMDFALDLAEGHGAHLVGIGFSPVGMVPYYGSPDLVMPAPMDYFTQLGEEAQRGLDAFTEKGNRRGLSIETRLIEASSIDFPREFALHALHVDISVLGQPENADGVAGQGALLEHILFATGRPVLAVPHIGADTAAPETVMVAWDGSPPAARAVNDALPFLQAAKKTIVFVARPEERSAIHGDAPGADMALHLARHGVTAEVAHAAGDEIDVGNLMLSRAADFGADMLVMGAYSHSRLREFVLGGVTKTIIGEMTVPVLMAH